MPVSPFPRRWSDGPDGSGPAAEQRLGSLLQAASAEAEQALGPARLSTREAHEIRVRLRRAALKGRAPAALASRVGWIAAGSAALAFGSGLAWTVLPPARQSAPVPTPIAAAASSPALAPPVQTTVPPSPMPASVAVRPASSAQLPRRRPLSVIPKKELSAARAVDPAGSPAAEALWVAGIFKLLNVARDPAGTLQRVAEYRRTFPDGQLRGEVATAEVEADLALGQQADALALLGRLGDSASPELQLRHAELLVQSGGCAAAAALAERLSGRLLASENRARLEAVRDRCPPDPDSP